jgi:anti-sigma factor RsiW
MDGLDKLTMDDRFELLSAYVDNELSVGEKQQVEAWLESDPEMKQQYRALSAISRSFQSMPMPTTQTQSSNDMLEAVFAKVDRKPRLLKLTGMTAIFAGISALGALFVAPILSPQLAKQNPPQVASQSSPPVKTLFSNKSHKADLKSADTDSLMLVLEAPPVDIPIVSGNTTLPDSSEP